MSDLIKELEAWAELNWPQASGITQHPRDAAVDMLDLLRPLIEAADGLNLELANPAPCVVMRKKWREQMGKALTDLRAKLKGSK